MDTSSRLSGRFRECRYITRFDGLGLATGYIRQCGPYDWAPPSAPPLAERT